MTSFSLTTESIQALAAYPFRDQNWVAKWAVAAGLLLLGFVVPIVPWILYAGYHARLLRRAAGGEPPALPEWDDWPGLFREGLRLVAAHLVLAAPFVFPLLFGLGMFFLVPLGVLLLREGFGVGLSDDVVSLGLLISFGLAMIISFGIWPLGLAYGVLTPAALAHVVVSREAGAVLAVREWWAIFRANLGGFLVTFAIIYGIALAAGLVMQAMMATLVLICALPPFWMGLVLYLSFITYQLYGWAYRDGVQRLKASAPPDLSAASAADPSEH